MRKTRLKLSAFAIIMVFMGSGAGWADLTTGLVAHWTFDEDSGNTAHDSVGGNDGTLVNGPIWTTGIINGAIDFDGANDYMTCGDILDNEMRNAFTIGAWIKLDEGALQKTHNYVFWKSDDRPGIFIRSNGTVAFSHWYQSPGNVIPTTHILEEEKWYYLTYIFNGSEFLAYINAGYTGSVLDSGYSPGGTVRIASDNTSYRTFKGMMDDFRIYNRALSAEEIGELYSIPEPATLTLLALGGMLIRKRK